MRRAPPPPHRRRRPAAFRWLLAAVAGALATAPLHGARQTEQLLLSPGQYSYRYLLYLPPAYAAEPAAAWPLLVMLHGSGAVGQPMSVMSLAGPGLHIEQGRDFPAVVVSPQNDTYNWQPDALAAFIDDVASLYRIDRDRITVTGMSMGGYGTWSLATAYPERYAAIAPVCGGGNPNLAPRLRDVPVWAFHGALDATVPLARSQEMIDRIRAAGGEPRFTIYPGTGHDAWTPAYANDELYAWLLAQNRANGPEITQPPVPVTVAAGAPARLAVTARGAGLEYQWLKDGFPIPGHAAALELPAVTAADAGEYTVIVSHSRAASVSRPARLAVLTAPALLRGLPSLSVAAGTHARLHVEATGGELAFGWRHDGRRLPDATGPTLTLEAVTPADAGTYDVTITNPRGEVTSRPATLRVEPAAAATRIVNLSVRAQAGAGDQTLIIGFTIGGPTADAALPVLLRAAGPALRGLGVTDALADPALVVFDRAGPLVRNGEWHPAEVDETTRQVGAFPFVADSRDAAVQLWLTRGGYTMHASSSLPGGVGTALLECYDAGGPATASRPELRNISARAQVGRGDGVLVAGFVVTGPGTRRVLVRGLGPALADAGVTGGLANPTLRLFRRGIAIGGNDDWSGTPELRDAAAQVGASPLPPASRDAALVAELSEGIYSAHVRAADGAAGIGLVEVYALP